jgi:hypothetical protein
MDITIAAAGEGGRQSSVIAASGFAACVKLLNADLAVIRPDRKQPIDAATLRIANHRNTSARIRHRSEIGVALITPCEQEYASPFSPTWGNVFDQPFHDVERVLADIDADHGDPPISHGKELRSEASAQWRQGGSKVEPFSAKPGL